MHMEWTKHAALQTKSEVDHQLSVRCFYPLRHFLINKSLSVYNKTAYKYIRLLQNFIRVR